MSKLDNCFKIGTEKMKKILVGVSEPESSPLKYLPRLVKRSTSIDITPNSNLDASPPSDPWRFFSDIKVQIETVKLYSNRKILG